MTLKMAGLMASLAAVALTLSTAGALAGAGGAKGGAVAAPLAKPGVPLAPRPFGPHVRRGFAVGLWPAGGYYYGAPYGEPLADVSAPLTDDVNYNYTYKQDVPWDWAHRFPPNVAPSDRPYVPGCASEPVTVPGRSGDHMVNVIRCY